MGFVGGYGPHSPQIGTRLAGPGLRPGAGALRPTVAGSGVCLGCLGQLQPRSARLVTGMGVVAALWRRRIWRRRREQLGSWDEWSKGKDAHGQANAPQP